MKKKINKVLNIILFVILGIILVCNVFILYQTKIKGDENSSIFGYKPYIVMSGSMEKTIYTNDMIFIKKVDTKTLKEKDIIAFKAEDGKVVTHRIVEILNEDGKISYITKGDNNLTKDSDPVKEEDVEGIYKFKISKIGEWFLFVSKPVGKVVSVLIAIIIIFIYMFINEKIEKTEKNKEEEIYKKEFEEFKKNNPHKK